MDPSKSRESSPGVGSAQRTNTGGVLPNLAPPTEEEANTYYRYLPSRPRLIGSTIPDGRRQQAALAPFSASQYPGLQTQPRRVLGSIGTHAILGKWRRGVEPRVRDALSSLPWTSIDVFRIGLESYSIFSRPVVVWCGVDNADLPWDSVVAPALRACRRILDEAGLRDVECEFRRSKLLLLNGPRLLPPMLDGGLDKELHLWNNECSTIIGQSISPSLRDSRHGSLTLFLASTDGTNSLWALTARHVALPFDAFNHKQGYRAENVSGTTEPWTMGVPSENILDVIAAAEDHSKTIEHSLHEYVVRSDESSVDRLQVKLRDSKRVEGNVKTFRHVDDRVIGTATLAPPYQEFESHGHRWIRDWCLVKLDREKLPNDGASLRNQVDLRVHKVQNDNHLKVLSQANVADRLKYHYPPLGILTLSGTVGLNEIRHRPVLDKNGKEAFCVGKNGAASGLTFGNPSGLESTVRQSMPDGSEAISYEWAIKGSLGDSDTPFSKGGDSGSLVFDVNGRAAGMLTSGAGQFFAGGAQKSGDPKVDVTYATPIEVILEDIEAALGQKVKIL